MLKILEIRFLFCPFNSYISYHNLTFFTAYYRFVVLFFNCLLTFGSYFCFDIPSVLQDQFQGVSLRKRELKEWQLIDLSSALRVNITKAIHRFAEWLPLFPTEPHVSQYNSDQWDDRLCFGTGDEPSAVQPSLCYLRLDVSMQTHLDKLSTLHTLSSESWT